MKKRDLENRADVELLVNSFYEQVKQSPLLGYIFNEVAAVNWDHHLPRMYAFWASILLDEQSFSGNPMKKHVELSKLTPMRETEFAEWLAIFSKTVNNLFEGAKAEEAKVRAANIARLMLHKIQTV